VHVQVNFMLSGNDVEVDDGDYHQRTALHLAASSGHIAMVRHLVLIHGANMNVLDRSALCFLFIKHFFRKRRLFYFCREVFRRFSRGKT